MPTVTTQALPSRSIRTNAAGRLPGGALLFRPGLLPAEAGKSAALGSSIRPHQPPERGPARSSAPSPLASPGLRSSYASAPRQHYSFSRCRLRARTLSSRYHAGSPPLCFLAITVEREKGAKFCNYDTEDSRMPPALLERLAPVNVYSAFPEAHCRGRSEKIKNRQTPLGEPLNLTMQKKYVQSSYI